MLKLSFFLDIACRLNVCIGEWFEQNSRLWCLRTSLISAAADRPGREPIFLLNIPMKRLMTFWGVGELISSSRWGVRLELYNNGFLTGATGRQSRA